MLSSVSKKLAGFRHRSPLVSQAAMSDNHDPGGAPPPLPPSNTPATSSTPNTSSTPAYSSTTATLSTARTTATLAWARGRNSADSSISASLRSYAQIYADAAAVSSSSDSKIILQFRLAKILILSEDGNPTPPKSLTHDEFGDFIFDILKINPENCLEIDLSGRWDTKELVLKAGTEVEHLLTTSTSQPHIYLNHEIAVTKISKNVTKVNFRNVPPSVPDEEILHLCKAYSEVIDNKVHREVVRLGTSNRRNVTGTTRYVEVRLLPGKFFKNYYWLEGPLPGDQGRRITVLHSNQPQQCSNCFRYPLSSTPSSAIPCPGGGNGKTCENAKTPRARMSEYTTSLRLQDRYVSMKTLYLEQKEKSFPSLHRRGQPNPNLNTTTPSEEIDALDAVSVGEEEQDVMAQSLG